MFVLKAMFWVSTRSHAELPDNARGAWKHVQTRHSLCISGSMDMRESNERAMEKKTSVFTHFVRISRILFSVYLNICFHLPYTSKCWCFSIFFNKKIKDIQERKPISNTFKVFKLDSWNSRAFKLHINPEVNILE